MTSLALALEDLRCGSLINDSTGRTSTTTESVRSPFGAKAIVVARTKDVLYVPELRLQVVDQRLVPAEAIIEPWTLEFEIKRDFHGLGSAYRAPFETAHSDREVCILSNFYSRNFFHWITDELTKVTILERHGFRGDYVLHGLPKFAFEFMEILGIEAARIVRNVAEPTIFAAAVFTTAIHAGRAVEYGEVFAVLRDLLLGGRTRRQASSSSRLWMDRGEGVNNPGRELVNTEEVYALLSRYGFAVIDMARLPVREQLATAHSAEALSGPHGAAFIHALFMNPQSAVIECFSPLFINPGVFEICRMMDHKYSMLAYDNAYAGYPWGNRLMVNCSHLELVLQSLG